jgi:hypothetical protein
MNEEEEEEEEEEAGPFRSPPPRLCVFSAY